MKMTTGRVLAVLFASYPEKQIPKKTMQVYVRLLSDLDPALLEAACLDHISNNKWFPTIAELRGSVAKLQIRALGIPDAYEAWAEVLAEIRKLGSYGEPEFSSVLIQSAVDGIGGWRYVCLSENVMSDRARFIDAYDRFATRETEDLTALPQIAALTKRLALTE